MRSPPRLTYLILTVWSLVVLGPVWILLINSFKPQREIFETSGALAAGGHARRVPHGDRAGRLPHAVPQ